MSELQIINQLKFRVSALEASLSEKSKEIDEYRHVEEQADAKIKAISKLNSDKVKSLLNSIQVLKKEKASIEGQSKQHKRSKLIEQLNKEILDQDLVIEVLRKFIYDDKGKEPGRNICDQIIVKALTKGPQRIRPLSREELRIQIDKLKNQHRRNDGKLKNTKTGLAQNNQNDELSQISSVSEQEVVNQNEELFKRLRDLQLDNENIKLEVNSKSKIIQKLKNDLKEKDKLKAEVEMLVNEMEIAQKKVRTYEQLLKQSKESTNNKIIELYEREIKVEELQIHSRESGDKLKQLHESNNILIQEIQFEKEQIAAELDSLKKENEQLLLENITNKKRQDEQKNKIVEIREINDKNKNELGDKLKQYEAEVEKYFSENKRINEAYRNLESVLFRERAEWVEEKSQLLEELSKFEGKTGKGVSSGTSEQIDQLRRQNFDLKEVLEQGGVGSDNHILLERLENYRRKVEFYESNGDKVKQKQYYDQMFTKYNELAEEFDLYRKNHPEKAIKHHRKNIVEITSKEEEKLRDFSSGISQLHLEDIDSDILDNFDSSYDYSILINQIEGRNKAMPKITEADKELLKLISSDLWYFVRDDNISKKIDEAISFQNSQEEFEKEQLRNRIKEIKNLNHPQGKKIFMYEQQLREADQLSENVSVTSALDRQIDKYDSDVNIQLNKAHGMPNIRIKTSFQEMSDSIGSDVAVSSVKSGESNFVKKHKKTTEKAGTVKINAKMEASENESIQESSFNSDVSSVNLNNSELEKMNSEVSVDFRKKHKK